MDLVGGIQDIITTYIITTVRKFYLFAELKEQNLHCLLNCYNIGTFLNKPPQLSYKQLKERSLNFQYLTYYILLISKQYTMPTTKLPQG